MNDVPRNDLFLRACRREKTERTPVWIMRQAGRYLPDYRAVRAEYDFLTMVKTPELAAKVTVQPVDIIGVDAAILFSDIMVIPEAMGMHLEMVEKRGPVLRDPIRSSASADALRIPDPANELSYVLDGIRATQELLDRRVPLIGFSGSPWTLFAYMVEGSGSRDFRHAKSMVYGDPDLARRVLDKITQAVGDYMVAQAEAGADALQIFDSWGGALPPEQFAEFSLSYIERIVERLRSTGVPVIVFCRGASHSYGRIAESGCHVVGVDWTTGIDDARKAVGNKAAVQGNLDPTILFAGPEKVREGVADVLRRVGRGGGHVFNLGHGILPETPVENVHALIRAVADLSPQYHEG